MKKISKTVGIIARLRHFVPLNTLKAIYKALLSSYLSYGIVAWEKAAKTHANQPFFYKSVPFLWRLRPLYSSRDSIFFVL